MKKIKWIVLCLIFIVQLCGCSVFSQNADSESVIGSSENETVSDEVDASKGEETTEEPEETESPSTEGVTTEKLIADSVEKEYLLKVLWGKMLQQFDGMAPNVGDSTDWSRTYEAEVHLHDFSLDTFKYGIHLIYPESIMASYIYYWPDYITDVRVAYREADEKLQPILDEKMEYIEGSSWITSAREQSELHVSGKVTNISYEQADLFIEGIKPYTAYMMWGSVLQVAGDLYEQNNGTILGNLSGKAVMTAFDFDTVTGTYWICLTGEEPIQVVVDFVSLDCGVYTSEINSTAMFNEAELESAWIGIEFDLCTTQTLK
ncbi:MAG: hypothetical protein IJN46_09920 [Lachnospiraceae bacterium]|nr:hypothetical protein [Lachnospiraceae bacterium]